MNWANRGWGLPPGRGVDTAVIRQNPARLLAARPGHRQRRAPLLNHSREHGS
jgi:hypothetical protein